jgi:uncharacterized protein YuzB (UPF0349 family)
MKVRFCEHNKGMKKAVKRLRESQPGLDVKVKDCIGKCGLCHKSPFALVDGKPVAGLDGEDLYNKVMQEITKRA